MQDQAPPLGAPRQDRQAAPRANSQMSVSPSRRAVFPTISGSASAIPKQLRASGSAIKMRCVSLVAPRPSSDVGEGENCDNEEGEGEGGRPAGRAIGWWHLGRSSNRSCRCPKHCHDPKLLQITPADKLPVRGPSKPETFPQPRQIQSKTRACLETSGKAMACHGSIAAVTMSSPKTACSRVDSLAAHVPPPACRIFKWWSLDHGASPRAPIFWSWPWWHRSWLARASMQDIPPKGFSAPWLVLKITPCLLPAPGRWVSGATL